MGRRARRALVLLMLAGVLALVPSLPGADRPVVRSAPTDVERALQRARQCKRAMAGRSAQERAELRERAIVAYESVYRELPESDARAAEAAFRAGELARAAGDQARARAAFGHAVGAIPAPFAFRAQLELGHLARRAGQFEDAARHYEHLLLGSCDDPYLRDAALFWLARVRADAGREEGATDALEQLRARLVDGALLERVERELARTRVPPSRTSGR